LELRGTRDLRRFGDFEAGFKILGWWECGKVGNELSGKSFL